MKLIALVVFAAVAAATANNQFYSQVLTRSEHVTGSNILSETFTVPLDHARPRDSRRVEFTYQYNLAHHDYYGPIYVYIKDGRDTTTRWIEEGLMVDIARQNNGALFTFNMRYFGTNLPTDDASIENFDFLTPEQILHDIAELIAIIRQRHASYYSQVILWGSGYGATIATWARKKFPHLVDAVWASSGVYDIETQSTSKYDRLGSILYYSNEAECSSLLLEALESIEELMVQENGAAVQEHFNLCRPVDTADTNDISYFYEALLDYIIDFINEFHFDGVNNICRDINALEGNALGSLARWYNHVRNSDECQDWSYESFVAVTSNTEWNQLGTQSGRRQWAYLQCTQSGLFQVTDSWSMIPNRLPLSFHIRQCQDILGEEYERDNLAQAMRAMINTYGTYVQHSTKVIYTGGYLDTMMYHSIVYPIHTSSFDRIIDYVARSADLTSIRGSDPADLSRTKQFIVQQITEWSNEFGFSAQNKTMPTQEQRVQHWQKKTLA